MRFSGNRPESEAAHYNDRRFTHTETVNGKAVNFYDCWSHEDEKIPGFDDEKLRPDLRQIDRYFRQKSKAENLEEENEEED